MNDNVYTMGFGEDIHPDFFIGMEVGRVWGILSAVEHKQPRIMMVHTNNIRMINDLCLSKGWRAEILSGDDLWSEIEIVEGVQPTDRGY